MSKINLQLQMVHWSVCEGRGMEREGYMGLGRGDNREIESGKRQSRGEREREERKPE